MYIHRVIHEDSLGLFDKSNINATNPAIKFNKSS